MAKKRLSERQKTRKEKASAERPKYFQGILQIRNPNEKIMNFALNEFDKSVHYYSKIAKVRGGYDIYSSSNRFSRKLARKMYDTFGGELKESEKLFTQDKLTSKKVYRLNVLYRAPDYVSGDIVYDGKDIIVVTSMKKDRVHGIDIHSRKKKVIESKKVQERLVSEKTSVTRVKPHPEALHPETYQSVEIENPVRGLNPGQEIDAVVVDGKLYMISI